MGMSAEERLTWVKEQLDKYEQSVGLTTFISSNEDYRKYMNLSSNELRAMTAEECKEGAYLLSDFAHHVEKQYNREHALAGWCEREIWRNIAPDIDNYKTSKYQSNDELKHLAITGNEYTSKLYLLQTGCVARADQLRNISNKIEKISDRLSSLGYSKGNNR